MGSLGEPMARSTEAEAENNQLLSTIAIAITDLISGSSDALDELKKSKPGPSAHGELFIYLILDKAAKTLTVADSGAGVAKSDLFKHVGAIARTVTDDFSATIAEYPEYKAIGLRFFPACLVANKVVVTTKGIDGQKHLFAWERGSFAVELDPDGEPVQVGTKIKMFLKDEFLECLEDDGRLEELVSAYSAGIVYPIYLFTDKAAGDGGSAGAAAPAPALRYKVRVCVEGVPAHARRMETVAGLLGRFGLVVQGLDGGALLDKEEECVCAWVWTRDPDDMPREGTLFIQEPRGPIWPSFVHSDPELVRCPPCAAGPPRMQAYKLIIHVDRLYYYSAGGGDLWPEYRVFPWDLGVRDRRAGVAPPF